MNWTTKKVYLTFLRGCSIQEGDLFKRMVISRAYGILLPYLAHKIRQEGNFHGVHFHTKLEFFYSVVLGSRYS